jgi:hypothetical protein
MHARFAMCLCTSFCCMYSTSTTSRRELAVVPGFAILLAVLLTLPAPLQLWGNSMHIAPELHQEAKRVLNTALVAELRFDKQVSAYVTILTPPLVCQGMIVFCALSSDDEPSPCAMPASGN